MKICGFLEKLLYFRILILGKSIGEVHLGGTVRQQGEKIFRKLKIEPVDGVLGTNFSPVSSI